MDIEGAEVEVLEKLIESGAIAKVRLALVETHDHKIPELREATDRLRATIDERGLSHIRLDWV